MFPPSVDALRERIVVGNAARFGADANVHARIPAGDHVRRENWLRQIEAQWGPAPGKQQSDGSSIFVLGERFGNVFVGIQPAFGYEGDPMRLLFEKGFAPTHAFSAFYRWLREDFGAGAVLHFGTHGALEFMPGKQAGLSGACWPDRMIGDLPNLYLYASNNPSEGTIAKRRSAATLISYLTPPVAHAGLYKGLVELKASIERWRGLPPGEDVERAGLATLIQAQASALELAEAEPAWTDQAQGDRQALGSRARTRIHADSAWPSRRRRSAVGRAARRNAAGGRRRLAWRASRQGGAGGDRARRAPKSLPRLTTPRWRSTRNWPPSIVLLAQDHEIPGILHALDGKFVRPAPGGDLLRTPAILPTGRNLHGFDPFRIPSAFAVQDGALQAQRLIDKHVAEGHGFPESVAIVLWGTDNLKNEGAPIGQALALLGAQAALRRLWPPDRRRTDSARATQPSAHRRHHHHVRHLPRSAAAADQAAGRSLLPCRIRRRAGRTEFRSQACAGLSGRATIAIWKPRRLRVFGNADGAYGSNVNHLVENGRWDDEDELAETYTRRKSFAYGLKGQPVQQTALLKNALATVDLAYQNLDSVELGVTTVDHYFDTLGGISRAVRTRQGRRVGAGLYRRPDPRRRHGSHAVGAGRAGDPHPDAQSEMVRGHAQAWL